MRVGCQQVQRRAECRAKIKGRECEEGHMESSTAHVHMIVSMPLTVFFVFGVEVEVEGMKNGSM